MKYAGFMLMEMVVVMALCALLVTIGFYAHATIQHISAYADLALVRLALRSTAFKAIVTGTACTVRVGDSQKFFFDDREYRCSSNLSLGVLPGISGPPSTPVRTISEPVTYQDRTITCHPDGLLQAGTLYFIDNAHRRQYALTTPVSSFSYIRIYSHHADGWHAWNT